MPQYRIKTHVVATVRETWEVEAENEEEARAGNWTAMTHFSDETLGDEEDRTVVECERID